MTEARRPRGRYFEEINLDEEVVSAGRTVTETDVVLFASLSGDYNQLHTDAEFAKGTPFGARIAHGLLGLSIASGLADRTGIVDGTALAFMALDWRFRAPVFIGDTISLHVKATNKRKVAKLGGGIVFLNAALHNQRGEVVQEGTWRMLVKGLPSS